MDLSAREYKGAKIQASTHESEHMRVKECKDKRKHTWNWGYEEARILTSTDELEGMRMWGCEVTSKHTRTWGHDMRMWGCKNTTKYTGTWVCEDVRMPTGTHEP